MPGHTVSQSTPVHHCHWNTSPDTSTSIIYDIMFCKYEDRQHLQWFYDSGSHDSAQMRMDNTHVLILDFQDSIL